MCEPATLMAVSIAISAPSAGAGLYAQGAASKRQGEYQNKLAIDTGKNANTAAVNDYQQLALNDMQLDAQAGVDIQQSNTEAAQAMATARVASGEAGVAGLSVDALLADLSGQSANYRDNTTYNLATQKGQNDMTRKGIRSTAQNRIISTRPKPVANPDYVGAALRVGSDSLRAYGTYEKAKMAQRKPKA